MYVTYYFLGPDCQILAVQLKPGEQIESEPGAMMFMSPGIKSSVEFGRCSRICTGETLCKTVYTNKGNATGYLGITPNFPAKVVPVDLSQFKRIFTRKGSYFSSVGDVEVSANCDFSCFRSALGGLGCIRQEAKGTGTVFLGAGGTVVSKILADGETFVVDEDSVVGYQDTVDVNIRLAGWCCTCCLGGEGMFLTTMTGPGLIVLQSMPFEKFKAAVAPPARGAEAGDEGAGAGASSSQ